ncbi:Ff.00g046630.m01.CDS01 [Fusarium sp. VM40]|nr:Ff.00g046630.m01.CDS01 [Fusarium sp. VM40]
MTASIRTISSPLSLGFSPSRTPSPHCSSMASKAIPVMNPWEVDALNYEFPQEGSYNVDGTVNPAGTWRQVQDPVIYPGLYAPSGIDIMSILFRVMGRPNPQVVLGPVDCSVAMVVCDMGRTDAPVIYVSESFSDLTGYSARESLGRNCRFLQSPPGQERHPNRKGSDKVASHRMHQALLAGKEIQTPVTNYKKFGQAFNNLLTIIPVPVDNTGSRYCIGFLCEMD